MFEIIIASDMEREDLFAEVHFGNLQLAEIINDPSTGTLVIELFDTLSHEHEPIGFDQLQEALEQAKARLASIGYPEKRE